MFRIPQLIFITECYCDATDMRFSRQAWCDLLSLRLTLSIWLDNYMPIVSKETSRSPLFHSLNHSIWASDACSNDKWNLRQFLFFLLIYLVLFSTRSLVYCTSEALQVSLHTVQSATLHGTPMLCIVIYLWCPVFCTYCTFFTINFWFLII